jgi:hypothetical protein
MKKIIFLFASLIGFCSVNAQVGTTTSFASQTLQLTIPQVALIAVQGTPIFSLSTVGIVAGQNLADATVNGVNLQYTSIMAGSPNTKTRTIYVTATSAATVAELRGFNLSVLAATTPMTNAVGGFGTANTTPSFIVKASVTGLTDDNTSFAASASSQKLITGITSCYTGTATTDGPSLTYKASIQGVATADFTQLRANIYIFVVYFTLADNA